jgi:hypothetical protein
MDDVVATSCAARRLTMLLLTGFAVLAIILAVSASKLVLGLPNRPECAE